jgi:UDP-N-acetylmuramyl pentapeptide phosphotransferase/UDP-N-acetylglucosamine-1-phosphate transferase
VSWLSLACFPESSPESLVRQLTAFTIASAVLMLVGVIDDCRGMTALVKLGGQMLAAALFFVLEPALHHATILGYQLPQPLAFVIFMGWCVLLINAFNLIDGLDGLCSGLVAVSLCVLAALGFAAGQMINPIMILMMLAAVLGFMRYNINPAKIFLGDAGSMMLGFYLATSATLAGGERALIGSIMLPIAIAGIPLLDVLLAVWRRSAGNHLSQSKGGEKVGGIFSPDKSHLHHRFLELGLTQRRVAFLMQGSAVMLAALCFVPIVIGGRGLIITLAGLLVLGLVGVRHFARVELVQSGSLLHLAVKRRKGRALVRAMYYFYDLVALSLAGFLAITIETNAGVRNPDWIWSANFVVLFVVFEVIALHSARIYRRIWSRPGLREFFLLSVSITIFALVSAALWSMSKNDFTWSHFRCGFIGGQLAMWFILSPRALPEIIRELAVDSRHRTIARNSGGRKQILVYGAGTRGNLFVDFLKNCSPDEFKGFQIAGFLDENPKLRRRTLQGFKIFGGLSHLEELADRYDLDGVMVAITHMPEEAMKDVFETAGKLNLKVYQWRSDIAPREIFLEDVACRGVA